MTNVESADNVAPVIVKAKGSIGASSASQGSVPRLFLVLIGALVVTAAAAALPLSNKEIGLMLRSGYTSDAVLTEVTTRGALEALDPATKKSLLNFGANPQLVAALES